MESLEVQKRHGTNWSADMDYEVILTNMAKAQAQNFLDYIFYELKNAMAARSVEQDMKETTERLSYMAESFKLCDDSKLRTSGYRIIHLKRHRYFMLYKIVGKQVYVIGIYHDLQDYENSLN